jgi:hypothetical protein
MALRIKPPLSSLSAKAGTQEPLTHATFIEEIMSDELTTELLRKASSSPGAPPCDERALALLAARSVRDEKTGCLVWQGARERFGYGRVHYAKSVHGTHRLSYIAHYGPIPPGLNVLHACDNPPCHAIEHLFLGTQQQNVDDARRKGRMRWRGKWLNSELASEIKRRVSLGHSTAQIARDMKLKYAWVHNVKSGRAWREAQPPTVPLDPPIP